MKLTLNLASRDFKKIERWRSVLLLAFLIGVIISFANGALYYFYRSKVSESYQEKIQAIREAISGLEDSLDSQGVSLKKEELKALSERVEFYNRILESASFPWMDLLYELEDSLPPGVSLKEIQPDFTTSKVVLNGLALSFEDLHGFLRSLEKRKAFTEVFLLKQWKTKTNRGIRGDGWEFSISLSYRRS